MADEKCQVEQVVQDDLKIWAEELYQRGGWKGKPPETNISLPWPRTFEVEVSTKIDYPFPE